MKEKSRYKIEVLPNTAGDALFDLRENGVAHTPYETERMFYSLIRAGYPEQARQMIETYLPNGLVVVGRLSENELRQTRYWAVCCITLATRAAIRGGLDETQAFTLSDEVIRAVDNAESKEAIFELLAHKAIELADNVRRSKMRLSAHPAVRKCVNYIFRNLHGKITVEALAAECGLTRDYLSALFRKETGKTLNSYILEQKFEAAKILLAHYSVSAVAHSLGFCSDSHFIHSFKKQIGVTPAQYKSLAH